MTEHIDAEEAPGEVDTIWTIPNLVTLIRLLLLPVFVWVLFGLPSRQAAAWMLGLLGLTDWVDGYLARRLGQTSEFGKKFDPTVDRLWFVVGVVAIMINGAMPIWFGVAVLAREVLVGGVVLGRSQGFHVLINVSDIWCAVSLRCHEHRPKSHKYLEPHGTMRFFVRQLIHELQPCAQMAGCFMVGSSACRQLASFIPICDRLFGLARIRPVPRD